jgi:hypothetical protein
MKIDKKKYNERIAKFVGAVIEPCKTINSYRWVFHDKENPFRELFNGQLTCRELEFHKNLIWCMEVLNFISSKEISGFSLNMTRFGFICEIWYYKDNEVRNLFYKSGENESQIDVIYNAICKYLDSI